jgi:hypothetical protein
LTRHLQLQSNQTSRQLLSLHRPESMCVRFSGFLALLTKYEEMRPERPLVELKKRKSLLMETTKNKVT